jgi:UDP:flavonoid glycosyltransferase YjiC (YdhE family)
LAQWYDTYRFARRVEWLGIGAYGNPSVAPHVAAGEFSQALMKVVGNESMLARSRELAELCGKEGGRKLAADKILAVAHKSK